MRRCTLLLLGLTAAWQLLPLAPSSADYLGKTAAEWKKELTSKKDAQSKRNAAFALGKLGLESRGVGAASALIQCAQSETEDGGVRETAAWSLGQIVPRGHPDAVRLLCQLAVGKAEERIRRSAVVALGNCGSDTAEVRAALDGALDDASPAVRQNAVWALGEVCQRTDDLPVASLRKALRDQGGDKLVKRDAAMALEKILTHQLAGQGEQAKKLEDQRQAKVVEQARAVLDDLLRCAGHDYVELKKAACATLIAVVHPDDANAKMILTQACKDQDIEVRRNAALALATIGGDGAEAAVPVLVEALGSGDPVVRRLVALKFASLSTIGGAALPSLLQALASDPDEKVRLNLAVALAKWKVDANEVVAALVRRVLDPKETLEVRWNAASSLKDVGPCEQAVKEIPNLIKVLDNTAEPPKVRERVLWALVVHPNLRDHEEIFDALKRVLTDKTLRDQASEAKILRYFAAYLLGMGKQSAAPEEVFPVLLEFLKDQTINVYAGRKTVGGSIGESGAGKTAVSERGEGDGRTMAVQALENIGPQRVKGQPEILDQLRVLRDANPAVDQKLRDAAVKLLKDCGAK